MQSINDCIFLISLATFDKLCDNKGVEYIKRKGKVNGKF